MFLDEEAAMLRRFWRIAFWECVKRRKFKSAWEAFRHSMDAFPPKRWDNKTKLYEFIS